LLLNLMRSPVLLLIGWSPHTSPSSMDLEYSGSQAGAEIPCLLSYQTQRSYSIGLAPEDGRLMLTVDRLEEGEVSPYLTDVLMAGDKLELRGPIGGYFTWEAKDGGPLLLVAGGRAWCRSWP
jgi:hypothetical protein